MHSISDLTTFCRKTTGDVPPKLVGASTTVVGNKMYLFGGRLVAERRMVADLYAFDLRTLNWERMPAAPEDDVPAARYFHSADAWNNHLVIFGGMGNKPDAINPEDLIVLNDVRLFDLASGHWVSISGPELPSAIQPKARYAHLSSVTGDRLFVIGGQDINNVWLDDVYIYDLKTRQWIHRRDYQRHCGTYRSVAVAADLRVRMPQDELRGQPSTLGPPGTRFTKEDQKLNKEFTPSESLVHLPYSTKPTDDYPNDIYLYSNYNFTDVKRELEVFTPLPSEADFAITDRSSSMTGSALPPGLRFPAGAILGTHLIIAGTYLAHTYQSFSIWALDLITNTWARIDPGSTLSSGSWFRSCLWAEANKFMIFGNRKGNLVEDYNRRLLSWDHVATVDLEAFGMYQPPKLALEVPMQELGLAALEEEVLADFEIICDDGRKIRCSRQVLEERWPWFKAQLITFMQEAARLSASSSGGIPPLPTLPGSSPSSEPRHDPRLTPRSFQLSEPYPISLAFLQYFYTRALITPLQHAPAVLSQLLVLASTYDLPHLQDLVVHAMHRALSNSTSVGVYEVATLCSCRSLQIRALKTVMAYNQRRPTGRSRRDADGAGGGPGSGPGSGSGRRADREDRDRNGYGGGGGGRDTSSAARPRGMSDAYMRGTAYTGTSVGGGGSSRPIGTMASVSPAGYHDRYVREEDWSSPESAGSEPAYEVPWRGPFAVGGSGTIIVTAPRPQPIQELSSADAFPEESVLPNSPSWHLLAIPEPPKEVPAEPEFIAQLARLQGSHERTRSIMSTNTEREITSFVELLGPSVTSGDPEPSSSDESSWNDDEDIVPTITRTVPDAEDEYYSPKVSFETVRLPPPTLRRAGHPPPLLISSYSQTSPASLAVSTPDLESDPDLDFLDLRTDYPYALTAGSRTRAKRSSGQGSVNSCSPSLATSISGSSFSTAPPSTPSNHGFAITPNTALSPRSSVFPEERSRLRHIRSAQWETGSFLTPVDEMHQLKLTTPAFPAVPTVAAPPRVSSPTSANHPRKNGLDTVEIADPNPLSLMPDTPRSGSSKLFARFRKNSKPDPNHTIRASSESRNTEERNRKAAKPVKPPTKVKSPVTPTSSGFRTPVKGSRVSTMSSQSSGSKKRNVHDAEASMFGGLTLML